MWDGPLEVIGLSLGWISFVLWTYSFYPQTWRNFQKKSIQGYSLDFLLLNTFGYVCYSSFTVALSYSETVRDEYAVKFGTRKVPVDPNDVAFACHGLVICLAQGLQAFVYDRGAQDIARVTKLASAGLLGSGIIVLLVATAMGEVLLFFEYLGLMKTAITVAKYIPQVKLNYDRKSTKGFAIFGILSDFTGGICSLLQMVCDAIRTEHANAFIGNFTKMAIAMITFFYDVILLLQHYKWYAGREPNLNYKKLAGDSDSVSMLNQRTSEEDTDTSSSV